MTTTKKILIYLAIIGCACGVEQAIKKGTKAASPSEVYIKRELGVIQQHAEILINEGRMPVDFWNAETVLGQYGWHTAQANEPGARPSLALLRTSGSGGAFGAYTFYEPAFEQAKRAWWIHGVMRAGSDLLTAVNRNAAFDHESRCSYWASSDGKSGKNCPPPMNSPVGFNVGYMYQGPEHAKVLEVVDSRTLRLDRRSPGDVLQYDLSILPPDYVDMCGCRTPLIGAVK